MDRPRPSILFPLRRYSTRWYTHVFVGTRISYSIAARFVIFSVGRWLILPEINNFDSHNYKFRYFTILAKLQWLPIENENPKVVTLSPSLEILVAFVDK